MLSCQSHMSAVSTFHCSVPLPAVAESLATVTTCVALWEMRQTRGSLTSHWLMSRCCSNYLPCQRAETSSRSRARRWHVGTQRAARPADDTPCLTRHHIRHQLGLHVSLSLPCFIIGSSRSHLHQYCV